MRIGPIFARARGYFLTGAAIAVVACDKGGSPPASPAPPVTAALVTGRPGGAPTTYGAPLPPGWAWPFNQNALTRGLPGNTVYRPLNVAALRTAAGASRCAPVEVAPSVWITPTCARLGLSRSRLAQPRAPMSSLSQKSQLPAAIDLRTGGLDGPMKDQQAAGVCWSFAISTTMDNALLRANRQEINAPLHLIAHYEWEVLHRTGTGHPIVGEASWPYDPHTACKLDQNPADTESCRVGYGIQRGSWREDPRVVAERERADASGIFKIQALEALKSQPGDPDEIAGVLASGQAVYAELEFNMTSWSERNMLARGLVQDWQPDGVGGHAVAVTGYETIGGKRWFLIHNSWGSGWGDGGYARISEDMMRARLNDAFVVTLADAAGRIIQPVRGMPQQPVTPPPPPPPPPQANTWDCAGARLRAGEWSCTVDSPALMSLPVPGGLWLTQCRGPNGTPPGYTSHRCDASRVVGQTIQPSTTPVCVARVVNGSRQAACCPAGSTDPTQPGCLTDAVLPKP